MASQNQIIADNITSHVHNVYALIEDGSRIVAVDFDSVSGRVFWSDLILLSIIPYRFIILSHTAKLYSFLLLHNISFPKSF